MTLARDVYDVITSQPEIKEAIDKAILDFMKGAGFISKKEPTRQERITHLKQFIPQIVRDDFSTRFKDHLHFFGILLATIVESTYASTRGCVIEKCFLPGHNFYFPAPAEEPSLGLYPMKSNEGFFRALEFNDKSPYVFYALRRIDGQAADIETLRDTLDRVVLQPSPERSAFVDWLNKNGYETIELIGFSRQSKSNAVSFYPRSRLSLFDGSPLGLNLTDKTTKATIAEELLKILDFTRV